MPSPRVTATEFPARLAELRRLEAEAARDPGEERSRDHVTTPAYDAYMAAWRAFGDSLAAMDVSGWEDIRSWCSTGDEHFGDATYPGVHRVGMRWDPAALCVSQLLLEAIARRSFAQASQERVVWDDPRVVGLLSDARWLDFPHVFASVLVNLRGIHPRLLESFHPEPLTARLREAGYDPDLVEHLLRGR